MVAYSFKRRFVVPIQVGLGQVERIDGTEYQPKRQTIRADRKRHARPGEELQLYCGMRTKGGCFLIGRARCVSVEPIGFLVCSDCILQDGKAWPVSDEFARADGFAGAKEMADFWHAEHGLGPWHGVLIRWEPA